MESLVLESSIRKFKIKSSLNLNSAKDCLDDIRSSVLCSSSASYLASASYLLSSTNVLALLYSDYNVDDDSND